MKYWKLGCCWGSHQPDYYDMLLRRRIVICGDKKMEKGDWVLVCHGFWGDALAHISSEPVACTSRPELQDEFARYKIEYADWNLIADFDVIYELHGNEKFYYKKQGGICQLQQTEIIAKVEQLIQKIGGEGMIDEMIQLLKNAKQVIFTGAPGTGKTYLARQIAQKMILGKVVEDEKQLTKDEKDKLGEQMGFVQFHPSYDYTDFVEGLRPIKSPNGDAISFERRDGAFKAFCKRAAQKTDSNFDEVYSRFIDDLTEHYSEENPLELKTDKQNATFFVCANSNEGLNLFTGPNKKKQGSLTADKIKSFLTETTEKWWAGYYRGVLRYLKDQYGLSTEVRVEEKPYVFIIDEINRGDISKIFGELFFAMDKGYRGKKTASVKTQYDNLIDRTDTFFGGFYVPSNVYIIGTMNDIDRNVESMDFAIRRRFTWKEIIPSARFDAMWSDLNEIPMGVKDEARRRMSCMNAVIAEKKDGLGPAYQIGPAYFRELMTYKDDADGGFGSLWSNHLVPLVREYLRGFPNVDRTVEKIYLAYSKPQLQDGASEEGE